MSSPAQVLEKVKEAYSRLRGRPLDNVTAGYYASQIVQGRMKLTEFEGLLVEAPSFNDVTPKLDEVAAPEEAINVAIPVKVDVGLTEELLSRIFVQSKLYSDRYKPLIDVGRYIRENVSPEFWRVFYESTQKGPLDFAEFTKILSSYTALRELKQ